jgi:hypothetical protein
VSKPGDGLRDLAREIEKVARDHPEWSRAHEIVLHCTGYLQAVARCSDFNHGVTPPIMSLSDLENATGKSIGEMIADGTLQTNLNELPQWPFNKGERK